MMGRQAEKSSRVTVKRVTREVRTNCFQKKRSPGWLGVIMLAGVLFIEQSYPFLTPASQVQAAESEENVLIRQGGVAAMLSGQNEGGSGTGNRQSGSGENSSGAGGSQSGSGAGGSQSGSGAGGNHNGNEENSSGTGGNQNSNGTGGNQGESGTGSSQNGSSENSSGTEGNQNSNGSVADDNQNGSDESENGSDSEEIISDNPNDSDNDNNYNTDTDSDTDNDTDTDNDNDNDTDNDNGTDIDNGTDSDNDNDNDNDTDNDNDNATDNDNGTDNDTETDNDTDNDSDTYTPDDITARQALDDILAERTILAVVYLSAEYPIRQEPAYSSKSLVNVPSGQQVQIQGEESDAVGELWVHVTLSYKGEPYDGYIPRFYLACSDELFLQWEKTYGMVETNRYRSMRSQTGYQEIDQFPDSYRDALLALKQAHPNWIFVMQNTNLDWNTVVTNEMIQPRSLVPDSYPIYQKDGAYGTTGWSYATEDTLKYYLDPRNWIQDATIFQFELLTYNATYHTESAVQKFLNGTFMAGSIPGSGQTYANAFWTIGSNLSVSPFHLACRVYQEQGQGQSALISGTYPGYVGLYNYFNIGATGSTKEEEIITGLTKAREQNWTTRYASLSGGSAFVSQNYILKGQDTLYLQKFDVDNSDGNLYWHQYMQNIVAPTSEGKNIRKSYNNAGSLDNTFVFKIPVYQNMPYTSCPDPTQYGITVTPPAAYLTAYATDPALTEIWVDGVPYPSNIGTNNQASAYASDQAKTAIMYQYNTSGIPEGMYVWTLSYDTKTQKYVTTPIPALQDLLTYHGFSIRVTGKSGIRIKTGISSSLRGQLATSGAAGYTLKEYGSLVMLSANQGTYPFIKGGNKVNSSLAYGMTDDGMKDYIYETVGGRYRFTSVLVNLPVTQYKMDFAFRGYIILSKGGQDITLYGPPRSSNIYYLAKRALDSGVYTAGSAPDLFLRQLISDADNS